MGRKTLVPFLLALICACGSDDAVPASVPTPYGLTSRERLTSLEESFEFAADANVVRERELRSWTVDYDCFSDAICAAAWRSVKVDLSGSTLRMYVNAMELFDTRATMDRRPFQQGLYDFVGFLGGDWYLSSVAGTNVQQWNGMDMMNMSSVASRHDIAGQSLRYVEYMADYLCSIAWANTDVVDGVELDNMFPYVSWVNEGDIDLDGDGIAEDYWTMDTLWRDGYEILVTRLRSCAPDGFVITGRGHQFIYSDILDGQTVETGTYFADLGVIPGGAFGLIDRLIRLGERGLCTFNDSPTAVNAPEWLYHAERLYALGLLTDCFISLDGGLTGHGHLGQHLYPVHDLDLGRPLGPAAYPFDGLIDIGARTVGSGGSVAARIPSAGSWMLSVDYEYRSGIYGSSAMTIEYPTLPVMVKSEPRWQDGEIYKPFTTAYSAPITVSYAGPGHLGITGWRLWRVDMGTGYFAREYERGTVYYNVSATVQSLTTPSGKRVTLAACPDIGDGRTSARCGAYIDYRP